MFGKLDRRTETVAIRLTSGERRMLEDEARRRGVRVSVVARLAFQQFFDGSTSGRVAATRAGGVGLGGGMA